MYYILIESYERDLFNEYLVYKSVQPLVRHEHPQRNRFSDAAPQMSWDISQDLLNGLQRQIHLQKALVEGYKLM